MFLLGKQRSLKLLILYVIRRSISLKLGKVKIKTRLPATQYMLDTQQNSWEGCEHFLPVILYICIHSTYLFIRSNSVYAIGVFPYVSFFFYNGGMLCLEMCV